MKMLLAVFIFSGILFGLYWINVMGIETGNDKHLMKSHNASTVKQLLNEKSQVRHRR